MFISKNKLKQILPIIIFSLGLCIITLALFQIIINFNQNHSINQENKSIPIIFSSSELSDEELAGALPTQLNIQSGTYDQKLGENSSESGQNQHLDLVSKSSVD